MRKFEFRPWGWYITLDEGVNYKVKKIHLNPNTKLSLQYHHHRDEHWTVVEGSGKAIVNKNVFIMNDGDDMFIAKKSSASNGSKSRWCNFCRSTKRKV